MEKILVTGGTGNNGKAVLEQLARTDLPVRAMLKDPTKAVVKAPNLKYVLGDFTDSASLAKALDSIETAFLVTPYQQDFPDLHKQFIRAAELAGVKHIVQVSGVIADQSSPIQTCQWLAQAEQYLTASGLDWTILRAASFSNNFFSNAGAIANDGLLQAPYGTSPDAKLGLIDNRDIGAVAIKVLANPSEHKSKIYNLTNNELLNHDQIASIFSKILGKLVIYQPISDEQAKAGLLQWQVPEPLADTLIELWKAGREGQLKYVESHDVESLLGRKPLRFEQFVRDHATVFQG